MGTPVTLNEVAKKVGVSPRTVANALGGRVPKTYGRSAARAKEIQAVAKKLGYRPNAAARAVARGRFHRVGMILPHGRSSYIPHAFVSGLTHALAKHDYELAIDEMPAPERRKASLPHVLTEWSLDALINFAPELTEPVRETLAELGLPTIWINEKREHNAVYPDEVDGGRRLTAYLQNLGHRRISYVRALRDWHVDYEPTRVDGVPAYRIVRTPPISKHAEHYSVADRERGYVEAMRAAGLTPEVRHIHGQSPRERIVELTSMLGEPDRPSAIILLGEATYTPLLEAALACRLTIPRDLTVASFTWDGPLRTSLRLSGMRYWAGDVADLASEMLMDLIRDPATKRRSIAYTGHMLLDESIAPFNPD